MRALAHILTKKVGDAQNLLLASFFSPASLRRPCEKRIKTEDGAGLPLPFLLLLTFPLSVSLSTGPRWQPRSSGPLRAPTNSFTRNQILKWCLH